jgi:RimJ/RimL family protein N-acetyltransferase
MRRLILIAEDEAATPLGQIRFEARPDGDWVVDVSVAGPMRGRGMASQVIQLGVQAILNECRGVRIHAFVKPANVASVRAFERAGFGRSDADQVRGQAAIHFVLSMKDTDLRRN